MGQRCMEETAQGFNEYRAVRFGLMMKGREAAQEQVSVVLTVHNDWETLDFVKDNLNTIASTLMQVKRLEAEQRKQTDESELFSSNLNPLFLLMSATARENVMDKLSISLKKALLLMAMDRYSCDGDRICKVLGISRAKLEKELQRCGISRASKKGK